MKTKPIIFIYLILCSSALFAQHAHYLTEGTITYEKTINMYAVIKQQMGKNPSDFNLQAFDLYQRDNPQFLKLSSTLTFTKNKTLFTPIVPDGTVPSFGNPLAIPGNPTYIDLAAATSITQKELAEKILLKDSTRKIKWKLTDETREIAGYTCRRANAVIMDSIYVVAFYADRIRVSGGPESFTGLPGMILEVALPHENVTWLATKVNDVPVQESTLVPPKKGTVMDKAKFNKMLMDVHSGRPYYRKIWSL